MSVVELDWPPKTPPEEAEVVYSAEMTDQELKHVLNEIPNKIVDGLKRHLKADDKPTSTQVAVPQGIAAKLGIAASSVVILVALWGGFKYLLSSELRTAFEQPNKDFASLRDKDIGGMRKDVDQLRKDLDRVLDRQSVDVFRRGVGTPEEIKDAAKQLHGKVIVPKGQIQEIAKPLFQGKITPAKWEATTALLNLRSYFNTTIETAHLNVVSTLGPGDVNKNLPALGGVRKWALVENVTIVLDPAEGEKGPRLRRDGKDTTEYFYLIFRNCHIIYHGRPLTLIDVFFENCTFNVSDNVNGHLFAKTVLESDYLKFSGS